MHLPELRGWPRTVASARKIQQQLADSVIRTGVPDNIKFIAGVDVGFENQGHVARGAVAILSYPALELHEWAIARTKVSFPYVPGYLSFREVPVIIMAMRKVKAVPDIILCDGQGLAHPRRFGLACHLGVLTGMTTIGVAKSRLIGQSLEPGKRKGSVEALMDGTEQVGAVVRTRTGVKPLYVSIGHRIGLEHAVRITLSCCTRYRLPETTRWADKLASHSLPS